MLRDRDSAADCVQDTFCAAATILGDLREPDKLRPWLYSIARHQALKSLRSRRRERPSDDLPEVASHDAGPNTRAARMELSDLLSEAAGGLSERDRTAFELAYRHGMDGPELASALGVSQSNANTLVYRLRETSNEVSARCWCRDGCGPIQRDVLRLRRSCTAGMAGSRC